MSRLSCVHDQTFVRSPDYSCVHDQTFVRSPDYSCVHDQTFVRSPDYSCVHDQTFVRSPDYSCVHDQTFVRSPDYSCVHDQTFVRSPDYSCVHVQTFVRFSLFPDHVNLNARHPRRAFIWVWTYRLSVWDHPKFYRQTYQKLRYEQRVIDARLSTFSTLQQYLQQKSDANRRCDQQHAQQLVS